jgi:hypothetical protein
MGALIGGDGVAEIATDVCFAFIVLTVAATTVRTGCCTSVGVRVAVGSRVSVREGIGSEAVGII